jgi:large subunit ribosomal protein L21
MYAVIETGGKQYRVELGTVLEVERLDVEQGQAITLDRVLLVADEAETAIGRPVVPNATVEAEVLRQARGEKIDVFKYRPKARRRVKKGHRQELTVLRIADIRFNGRSAAELARRAEEAAKTERQRLEEAAARQAAADRELAARLAAKRAAAAQSAKAETAEPAPGAETTTDTEPATGAQTGSARGRGRGSRTQTASAEPSTTAEAAPAEPSATAEPAVEPVEGGATPAEAAVPESSPTAADDEAGADRPRPRRTRTTKKDE